MARNDKNYSFDSGTAFSAALNPIFECVPSQNGFSVEAPHRAKCHSFFDWELIAIHVDQFHFTRNDVGTMLDCFDFYHNAPNLTLSARAANRSSEIPSTRETVVSLGKACSLNPGERTLLACWSPHSAATNFVCLEALSNERSSAKVRDSRKLSESPARQRRALPRRLLALLGVKRKLGRL